jgi:hypothetical protein
LYAQTTDAAKNNFKVDAADNGWKLAGLNVRSKLHYNA